MVAFEGLRGLVLSVCGQLRRGRTRAKADMPSSSLAFCFAEGQPLYLRARSDGSFTLWVAISGDLKFLDASQSFVSSAVKICDHAIER